MHVTTAIRLDKLRWFPGFEDTRVLHQKLFGKSDHLGVGPGGWFDDVIDWVWEMHHHYNQSGEMLTLQVIPRLQGFNKKALAYEIEFLKLALSLLAMLPAGTQEVMPVLTKGKWVTLLVTFDDAISGGKPVPTFQSLSIEPFIRKKKIRGSKQVM